MATKPAGLPGPPLSAFLPTRAAGDITSPRGLHFMGVLSVRCPTPLCLLAIIATSLADDDSTSREQPPPVSAQFINLIERQDPNLLLPTHVPAPEGKVTVFADFAHDGAWIPIYLVNRTSKPLVLPGQDRDMGFKLEVQSEDGSWSRAQAHSFSWCGNSYVTRTLPPSQHLLLRGYRPTHGKRGTIRFAKRDIPELVSNIGEGIFAAQDVADASVDDLAGHRLPFLHLRFLLQSRRVPWAQRVATVRLLSQWEENTYVRAVAGRWLEEALGASDGDAPLAAAALVDVLATTWPATSEPGVFVAHVMQQIRAPENEKPRGFGALASHADLLWHTLADLAAASAEGHSPGGTHSPPPIPLEFWRPAAALACQRLQPGNDHNTARHLLALPTIADEFVPDDFFTGILGSPDHFLRVLGAETLARRQRWTRLVDEGRRLPSPLRLQILRALTGYTTEIGPDRNGPRRPEFGSQELEFWLECIRAEPVEAAQTLFNSHRYDIRGSNGYPHQVRDVLREFLANEVARSAAAHNDFPLSPGRWDYAVHLLASWRHKDDIPLLEQLLQHRGYAVNEGYLPGGKMVIRHDYVLRRAALEALAKYERPRTNEIELERLLPQEP